MEIRQGIGVCPGIAIADAYIVDSENVRIPQKFVSPHQVEDETARFGRGLGVATQQLQAVQEQMSKDLGEDVAAIFDAHLRVLNDRKLGATVIDLIQSKHLTAEYAVSRVFRRYIKHFQNLPDPLLSHRASDIIDIEQRLLRCLIGEKAEDLKTLTKEVVVLASDLTPSQTAGLSKGKVVGFATERGGRTSHTAIVARAMEIPAVVGLGSIVYDASGDDTIVVDGNRGLVVISPDEETLARYERERDSFFLFEEKLASELRDLPGETTDGEHIHLLANIEFPDEVDTALAYGAEGVGLYRTEFLYLAKMRPPTEEEHFQAYLKAVSLLGGRPIVIRTLDLGADKFPADMGGTSERNPFLGCRSIRFCFQNLDLFKTQIRAILRVSSFGNVKMLFPMITSLGDLRTAKIIVSEVMTDLERAGIPFDRNIDLGIMIEVPSAALTADILAAETDFFSVGTNDLTQYTLAVDRGNQSVAEFYTPAHPGILRLLRNVFDVGARCNIEVNVCGEMSADPSFTILLVGMGLKQFSVSPAAIPEVKKVIRSVSMKEANEVARKVAELSESAEISAYLTEITEKISPSTF